MSLFEECGRPSSVDPRLPPRPRIRPRRRHHEASSDAAIALTTAALLACSARPQPPAADDPPKVQQEKTFEKEVITKVKLEYLLFLPEGYDKSDKEYPLILFLHGAGESGTDVNRVKKHGMAKVVETRKDLPFIVVSPQSPGRGWNPDTLRRAPCDRIVLGLSGRCRPGLSDGPEHGRLRDLGSRRGPPRAVRGHRPDLRRREAR